MERLPDVAANSKANPITVADNPRLDANINREQIEVMPGEPRRKFHSGSVLAQYVCRACNRPACF